MNYKLLLIKVLSVVAATSLLAACSGGDDPKESVDLKVTASSVSEGETVDPASTDSVTLTFSHDITVVNPSHARLTNDSKGNSVPLTTGRVSGRYWTFPVALDYDSEYTLNIYGTTVRDASGTAYAEPFTLKFKTGSYKIPETDASRIQPLVNPNATAEAKKVYEYLKSQYGKKMLSGAMANVNNNNLFADWIYSCSGKYPAYTCYDFIHLPYSGTSNWIDYSNIDAAKNQWDNGGIVGYGWHWMVPAKNGSDLSYSCDETDFDIDRALTPGTWENDIVNADVAKVAGYLKLLQDAGIAVLWRPLHEAAGDYTWGAWFWWGKQGVEKTKKLWVWLYDKLTNEYGLNNLIWVWTVQLYREGKLTDISDLKSAYPGDEYVDIVGPDVYNDTHDASPDFFNIINRLVDSKKMIAMPECGMLPDPTESFMQGATWSYCMLWYTYDIKAGTPNDDFGNTPDYIKDWMANPYVITRSDMPGWK